MARRILITAGEASGDAMAAELVAAAREIEPGLDFFGAAGPAMQAVGVEEIVSTGDLAVMGLTEVVSSLPRIWRAMRQLGRTGIDRQPAGAILVDAPDFNLRLAPRLSRASIPVVQYVSPTVWAWRRGRVATIERWVRRLLLTLPFESEVYDGTGVDAVYVGHPALDRRPDPQSSKSEIATRLSIPPDRPWVALMPGSRDAELSNLGGVIAEAGRRVRASPGHPVLVAFAAPGVAPATIASVLRDTPDITIGDRDRYDVLSACDAAIVTSGTVSLELTVFGVPHVVVYRMSALTHAIARRLVRTRFIALPNLIADRAVVPEFLQSEARPDRVADAVIHWLRDPQHHAATRGDLAAVTERLGPPGVAERAARAALAVFGSPD